METKAVSRYVRIAPRKARIVVDLVRGKSVPQAREILAFCERAAAETVVKTLNSAVANAEHNNHLRGDNLVVKAVSYTHLDVYKRQLQHLGGLLGDVCGAGEALRGERDFDLPFAGAGDAGDEARVREARERSREGGGV